MFMQFLHIMNLICLPTGGALSCFQKKYIVQAILSQNQLSFVAHKIMSNDDAVANLKKKKKKKESKLIDIKFNMI